MHFFQFCLFGIFNQRYMPFCPQLHLVRKNYHLQHHFNHFTADYQCMYIFILLRFFSFGTIKHCYMHLCPELIFCFVLLLLGTYNLCIVLYSVVYQPLYSILLYYFCPTLNFCPQIILAQNVNFHFCTLQCQVLFWYRVISVLFYLDSGCSLVPYRCLQPCTTQLPADSGRGGHC